VASSVSDAAYLGIRQMLVRGELKPGQRLSQSRLARQLHCSPMPVVEAMRRLESEGLLEKQARKQARVRTLSLGDLEGLYLLREAIETVIARLAALRITPEEAQELQELARAYERAWEAQDHEAESDVAIHRHLAGCARCPLLETELERLRLIELTAGRHLVAAIRSGHPHSHRALVQAIVDHDAASAEYLMKKHIQHGYDEARREFEERQRPGKTRSKKEKA
jgi:DNA-binding GntR family transcriptional regulator